ncbi:MAG: Rrf2 family transcriptional regulator [Lentisphaeria bacterium]|nr:Rrf2 family transcriptional regulator [Lentisphaeria bacterium]
MKFSSKTRYGLRVLLHIALESKDNKTCNGREISSCQGLNDAYFEQIMLRLKNSGLIRTVRGRNGGYALAKKANFISLLDIIESLEGPFDLGDDQVGDSREAQAAAKVFDLLSDSFREELSAITLESIIQQELKQAPDYII